MRDLSPSERKELASKLKEELEKEGFKSNWVDKTGFQVEELPIPKIVPFDTAELNIRVDENKIFFEIIFYFIKVLEDCVEIDEIEKVYELHDKWIIELTSYFGSMDPNAKLKWDVEYDVDIEDSFGGIFDTVEEVITLVRNLKELIDKNKKRNNQ